MEQKRKRLFILLFCVLLILLAVYFGLQKHNKSQEKKKKAKAEAETIYVTDINSLKEIKYNVGNGDFDFKKEDDKWYDAKDKDFPLAQSYLRQMEDTFSKLKARRALKNGDSLEDYGLKEPDYTVVLTDGDGKETTLYYGNITGDDYYITVDDTNKVYTVSSTSISDLQNKLEDMAQLDAYPSIGSGNLKKVVITQNGSSNTYDSKNDDDSKNIAAAAGGLGAVKLETAADYSVDDKDLPKFGLDEASRITVEATYTKDKKDEVLILYLGSTDTKGSRYVMIKNSRIVYLISEDICNNILNLH
ncbi:DUF4340 domain-containing protein [Clostridium sp. C105KSO13]|uniref:DUF4340 domain-containing protein n=1 Tax=Clostridium sp. C105KSO13 TaxID=1776045 RepID=UPI0007408634|nr:DUF4340 domain-containing protein [Clostridium sp. C105KSO13]CUX25853.1 hypothetical protein BN3456_00850 [Clostridium sp. C105KSO13]